MVHIKPFLNSLFFKFHLVFLKLSIFMMPVHFYSPNAPIPDLRRTKDRWINRSEMIGVEMNFSSQLNLLDSFYKKYYEEYKDNKIYLKAANGEFGPGYGFVEAQLLHCGFVRLMLEFWTQAILALILH